MKVKSTSRFYLAADGDMNGTADVSGEHSEGYSTLEEAIKSITSDLEQHGGVSYIYECVPIKRLAALRVTVEDVAPDKA